MKIEELGIVQLGKMFVSNFQDQMLTAPVIDFTYSIKGATLFSIEDAEYIAHQVNGKVISITLKLEDDNAETY